MSFQKKKGPLNLACDLPRKHKAIEVLLSLAWSKEKKKRPAWLIKELSSYG